MIKPSKKSGKNLKNFSATKTIDLNKPFVCEWCHNGFSREGTLLSHLCEPKRRNQEQYSAPVKLAFAAYQWFYESTMPPSQNTKKKTYQEFSNSNYYSSFVKFGKWLIEQNVLEVEKYVKYLIKENIPFTKWIDRDRYREFIADVLLSETPEKALERSFDCVKNWSENSGIPWNEFWKNIGTNQAVNFIVEGKISAWMLYNSETAIDFLEKLSSEQLTIVERAAPIKKWKVRFIRYKIEADSIKQLLKEAGM